MKRVALALAVSLIPLVPGESFAQGFGGMDFSGGGGGFDFSGGGFDFGDFTGGGSLDFNNFGGLTDALKGSGLSGNLLNGLGGSVGTALGDAAGGKNFVDNVLPNLGGNLTKGMVDKLASNPALGKALGGIDQGKIADALKQMGAGGDLAQKAADIAAKNALSLSGLSQDKIGKVADLLKGLPKGLSGQALVDELKKRAAAAGVNLSGSDLAALTGNASALSQATADTNESVKETDAVYKTIQDGNFTGEVAPAGMVPLPRPISQSDHNFFPSSGVIDQGDIMRDPSVKNTVVMEGLSAAMTTGLATIGLMEPEFRQSIVGTNAIAGNLAMLKSASKLQMAMEALSDPNKRSMYDALEAREREQIVMGNKTPFAAFMASSGGQFRSAEGKMQVTPGPAAKLTVNSLPFVTGTVVKLDEVKQGDQAAVVTVRYLLEKALELEKENTAKKSKANEVRIQSALTALTNYVGYAAVEYKFVDSNQMKTKYVVPRVGLDETTYQDPGIWTGKLAAQRYKDITNMLVDYCMYKAAPGLKRGDSILTGQYASSGAASGGYWADDKYKGKELARSLSFEGLGFKNVYADSLYAVVERHLNVSTLAGSGGSARCATIKNKLAWDFIENPAGGSDDDLSDHGRLDDAPPVRSEAVSEVFHMAKLIAAAQVYLDGAYIMSVIDKVAPAGSKLDDLNVVTKELLLNGYGTDNIYEAYAKAAKTVHDEYMRLRGRYNANLAQSANGMMELVGDGSDPQG